MRRGDRAHRLARRACRAAAAAPAVPRPERAVGLAHQHQQRRNLVQRGAHRLQRSGLVRRDRQRQERRDQSVFAGGQGGQHGPGGDAAGHLAEDLHLRRGRGWHQRPPCQGGADRRPLGRLHPQGNVRYAGGLRNAGAVGFHHGLGRHGGHGRRQLHGGRGALLHRVHPFGIVRQVHSLPRGPRSIAAHPQRLHARPGRGSGPGPSGRNGPHDPRHFVVRAGPDRAQPAAHHHAALPPRVRGPHPRPPVPRGRVRRAGALALREQLPAAHEHPAVPPALQGGPAGRGVRGRGAGQSAARLDRPRLPAPLRGPVPAPDHRRIGEHARSAPVHRRRHLSIRSLRRAGGAHSLPKTAPHRPQGGGGGRGALGAHRGLLPGAAGARGHDVRCQRRARRHAALRASRISPAEGGGAPRGGADPAHGRELRRQRGGGDGHHAGPTR